MPKSVRFLIKPFLLGKEKMLTIEPDFLEFGDRFHKQDIEALRIGVKGIRGYMFYIGRVYCMDIKHKTGKIIKIRFRAFYKINAEVLNQQYVTIVEALFENFGKEISRRFLRKFSAKEEFEILGVAFSQAGLVLNRKWGLMPWFDISSKNYTGYYTLFSMSDPHKYVAFNYISDWNTSVLYSVSRQILKNKGLWKEPND